MQRITKHATPNATSAVRSGERRLRRRAAAVLFFGAVATFNYAGSADYVIDVVGYIS